MLQVTDMSPISEESIEIDEYIAINVEWLASKKALDSTYYWRTGDFKKSLFELGVSGSSGRILSFTLTSVNRFHVTVADYSEIKTPIDEGLPIFRINGKFTDGFFDEVNEFRVFLNSNGLRIFFNTEPTQVVTQMKSGQIRFGLTNQKALAMVEITDIKEEEYEKILLALNS
jgi:hypothetical protein